jgi:hypothetical protein
MSITGISVVFVVQNHLLSHHQIFIGSEGIYVMGGNANDKLDRHDIKSVFSTFVPWQCRLPIQRKDKQMPERRPVPASGCMAF